MNRKVVVSIVLSVIILILGFVIFNALSSIPQEEKPPKVFDNTKYVNTIQAAYNDHEIMIEAYGRLNSKQKFEVFSEVTGMMEIENKPFKVGTFYKKGEIIMKINDEELRNSINSQKAEFLNQLSLILPDLKIDYPEAFEKWNSYVDKYQIEAELKPIPEPANTKEKLFLASRRIFTQYYSIKSLETRLDKHTIRAPYDGVVTMSMIEPGSLVRMNQKIGEFSASGVFELELAVPVSEAKYIRVGNKVDVISERSGEKWQGSLVRLSKNINANTQTLTAFVSVAASELKEGMYMKGIIHGETIKEAIKLPRRALVNNSEVYLIKDSLLASQAAKVILLGEEYAYIKGIDSTETIISEPIVNATIGMKVESIQDAKQGM